MTWRMLSGKQGRAFEKGQTTRFPVPRTRTILAGRSRGVSISTRRCDSIEPMKGLNMRPSIIYLDHAGNEAPPRLPFRPCSRPTRPQSPMPKRERSAASTTDGMTEGGQGGGPRGGPRFGFPPQFRGFSARAQRPRRSGPCRHIARASGARTVGAYTGVSNTGSEAVGGHGTTRSAIVRRSPRHCARCPRASRSASNKPNGPQGHLERCRRAPDDSRKACCSGSAGCVDSEHDSRIHIIQIDIDDNCRISRDTYKWDPSEHEFVFHSSD
jgi:hypothetical protein